MLRLDIAHHTPKQWRCQFFFFFFLTFLARRKPISEVYWIFSVAVLTEETKNSTNFKISNNNLPKRQLPHLKTFKIVIALLRITMFYDHQQSFPNELFFVRLLWFNGHYSCWNAKPSWTRYWSSKILTIQALYMTARNLKE